MTMSEFKVGDRVRIIENDFEGVIDEVMTWEMRDYSNPNEGDYDYRYKVSNKNKFYTNLTNNELELIEASKELTLEELEKRIEKLEKCVMGEQNKCEKCVNVSSMSKNGLLTEDERVILRNIDKKYKWICKDPLDYLYVCDELDYDCALNIYVFNHLFKFVKQDKPYNIEELLKGECEE